MGVDELCSRYSRRVFGRVVLDPFLKAMFFTDDRTRKRIYELVREGRSFTEAVRIVSEEKS